MKKLIILLFIFFSCNNEKDDSLIIDEIPDNPLLVLSIDNVSDLDYKTINFISKSTNLNFDDINLLNPTQELIYSFHNSGKNNLNGIIIQKSELIDIDPVHVSDTIIYNESIILNYKDFFISKKSEYVIISKEKLLVENVLRDATFNKNDSFKDFKRLHSSKTKNISLTTSENYKNLKFNLKNENISNFSNWIQYEFDLENDDINILGVSHRDKGNREINIIERLDKSKSDIIKIVPNNFSSFKRMSFNKDIIQDNYNKFINNQSIKEKRLDSIFNDVKEIGEIIINKEAILIFKYDDFDLDELLEKFDPLNKYREQIIYDGKNINLSDFDILNLKISNNYDFITNIDDCLVLSNNLDLIQNLILNYNNQSVIFNDENFNKFLESVPNKTTFFEIINNSKNENYENFPFWFSNFELKDENNFKSIYTTPSFDLKKNKSLNLKFSKKFQKKIIINPTFIDNYKLGEKNIILQDSDLNLILLGLDEKVIFKKQLNSKIVSEIFQVDLYKNNRLQFIFLTETDLLVLDIKGNLVKKIALKKSVSNKYLSVFDYDNNRDYRFVIQIGNTLKMLDSKFKNVKGFKRNKVKSDIQQKLKHIRIMNKDYLILVTQDGVPFIYDRRGNIRIKLPKNLIIDQNDFYVNSNALVTINNLNQLVRVEINGDISSKQLSNEKHKIFANENNLLIQSKAKISINNNEFDIPYGNFSGLNIFGKKDKTYYHLRDEDNNQSYLFNKIGKIKGFPIFSKSNVDIKFEKNQDMITCVGDDNEILLYTIN